MGKVAILHFSPLELYPPVQNFIQALAQAQCNHTVYVFTTTGIYNELDRFTISNSNIRIIRIGKSGPTINRWHRAWSYLLFYGGSFLYLCRLAPKRILYYETLSAFPAWLYRRFFNNKVEVLIHYHEYTTPEAYENGMMLTRRFHHLEKWLYPQAKWVSHTNEFRMQLFEKDIYPARIENPQILPNYPPKAWFKMATDFNTPLKIVYIGSLSMDTMYTREFAKWVIAQKGMVEWHIYSYNISEDAKLFLQSLSPGSIKLKDGLNYADLPQILQQYNVGVILYTGHIPNYIYNAPNKLFEYLACGLDVWYPVQMKGIRPYNTVNEFPVVLPLDFLDLDDFNWKKAVSKEGHRLNNPSFFCEVALSLLVKSFCEEEAGGR
ncbi:MAG: hypothetical protein ABIN67_02115 [Ferruginibacter sp.]